jgi:DNA-binding transcriptional ArsR family regulator/uncharacterized damage-inducible protein DinB
VVPDPADPLDLLLRALADGTRRSLLDRLRDAPGQTLSQLHEGHAGAPLSRQALSKHLAQLEEAELVVPVWRGREKLHYLSPAPLQALPARWVTATPVATQAAIDTMREATVMAPDGSPATPPAARPGAARRGAAGDPDDALARLLWHPPSPRLQGQPVLNSDSLVAAREYLAETAAAVRALVDALPADAGYAPPADGSFALVEHLWHLADIETLGWRVRFERILQESRPNLPGVDGDRLAAERRYREQPWRGAARRFVAERRRTLALLERFDDEVLRRPVIFAGSRTRAGGVLAAAVAHDLDHRPAMALRWLEHAARGAPAATSQRRRTR